MQNAPNYSERVAAVNTSDLCYSITVCMSLSCLCWLSDTVATQVVSFRHCSLIAASLSYGYYHFSWPFRHLRTAVRHTAISNPRLPVLFGGYDSVIRRPFRPSE